MEKQSTSLYQWKREFSWLKFNSETELVTCNICAKNKKLVAEKWVEGFPCPFKKEISHGAEKATQYYLP